jgi:hypothetical protein
VDAKASDGCETLTGPESDSARNQMAFRAFLMYRPMQLPQLNTPLRKKTARRARAARRPIQGAAVAAPPPLEPPPAPVPPPERRDARRGGGPQDTAFYTCGCGYAFTASVSTSVGCPHCGTEQAW